MKRVDLVRHREAHSCAPPGAEAAPFVEYGWGDRKFYPKSDFRPLSVFATLVLPTEIVLYVEGRTALPRVGGAAAVAVRTVSASELTRLVTHIERYARRVAGVAALRHALRDESQTALRSFGHIPHIGQLREMRIHRPHSRLIVLRRCVDNAVGQRELVRHAELRRTQGDGGV